MGLIQEAARKSIGPFDTSEKKILFGTTVATIVGYLMQIIAISTDYWVIVVFSEVSIKNSTARAEMKTYSGIWRMCTVTKQHGDEHETCITTTMFPSAEELKKNPILDSRYLDYGRTQAAFSIIALVVMFLGHMFALYTFRRPRYIHKRLTALLHVMAAACILVINEVFMNALNYALEHLSARHPVSSTYHFGFSFVFSWVVFTIYLLAFLVFLFCSHKRKYEMADSVDVFAEEDESVQLGRV